MARKFSYTPEMMTFLKAHIQGTSFRALTEMFNARFGCDKTEKQIISACTHRKMCNGVKRMPKNIFSVGNIPSNYRPVGSERVNIYGFVVIKVADPNCWRLKHRIIWEEKNGVLPKGATVIFADGNKQNFNSDNLIMLPHSQFLYLRRKKLLSKDADMNRTVVLLAELASRVSQLRKQRKNG